MSGISEILEQRDSALATHALLTSLALADEITLKRVETDLFRDGESRVFAAVRALKERAGSDHLASAVGALTRVDPTLAPRLSEALLLGIIAMKRGVKIAPEDLQTVLVDSGVDVTAATSIASAAAARSASTGDPKSPGLSAASIASSIVSWAVPVGLVAVGVKTRNWSTIKKGLTLGGLEALPGLVEKGATYIVED